MSFDLGTFKVSDVVLDVATRLDGEVPHVDQDELASLLMEDPRIKGVTLEVVKPGGSTRIVHLRDTVGAPYRGSGPRVRLLRHHGRHRTSGRRPNSPAGRSRRHGVGSTANGQRNSRGGEPAIASWI